MWTAVWVAFFSCKWLHNINQSKISIVLNIFKGGLEQVNHREVCVNCRLVAYHLWLFTCRIVFFLTYHKEISLNITWMRFVLSFLYFACISSTCSTLHARMSGLNFAFTFANECKLYECKMDLRTIFKTNGPLLDVVRTKNLFQKP